MASIAISSNHQALNDPKTNIPPVPMDTGKVSSKAAEAEHDTNSNQSHDNPPPYDSSSSSSHLSPSYQSIQKALTSLQTGSPDETISIPMIHRKDPTSLHRLNPFSCKGYENITHYISARQMKRSQYLAHYAKDAEGNYIGTGPPAPDAGLVFVVGKGTPEELLKQAEQVALGMQKRRGDGIGKFGKPL